MKQKPRACLVAYDSSFKGQQPFCHRFHWWTWKQKLSHKDNRTHLQQLPTLEDFPTAWKAFTAYRLKLKHQQQQQQFHDAVLLIQVWNAASKTTAKSSTNHKFKKKKLDFPLVKVVRVSCRVVPALSKPLKFSGFVS